MTRYGQIRVGRSRGPAVVRRILAGPGAGTIIVLSRWRTQAAAHEEALTLRAHELGHRVAGPCLLTGGLRPCSFQPRGSRSRISRSRLSDSLR